MERGDDFNQVINQVVNQNDAGLRNVPLERIGVGMVDGGARKDEEVRLSPGNMQSGIVGGVGERGCRPSQPTRPTSIQSSYGRIVLTQ